MCTILLSYQTHPMYPFIFIGNRDEFKKRPSEKAHFWEDRPEIFAGRDLVACGTWTGITTTGRVAFITNHRQMPLERDVPKSRGALTEEFLKGKMHPSLFLQSVQAERHLYAPFNLVVGHVSDLWFYSNIENEIKKISPGIHGLSNAFLDTPWYKVEKGKKRLGALLDHDFQVDDLFELLNDREIPPDSLLPRTGIPIELERTLASIHIDTPEYGTVFKTIILVDKEGLVSFYESTNTESIERVMQFKL